MTWLKQEDGQVVIDVFRKSDKKYDRWAISNCQPPDSTGGSQCAPSGGGCVSSCPGPTRFDSVLMRRLQDTNQILFGAQG